MVGVVIECRMGNQLFQYAFIRAQAKRLHTTAFINDNSKVFILPAFFCLKGYHPTFNFLKWAFIKLTSGNPFENLQSFAVKTIDDPLVVQPVDRLIYRGYFQSELFFKNIAGEIEKYITVRKRYRNEFNSKFGTLFATKKTIAVHVRRGDYLNLNDWWAINLGSSDLTLPANYYLKGLHSVNNYEEFRIIFVSDDLEFVKSTFGYLPNADFISEEPIIDFQILMNADVCIISNSSFSWWAAYLNNKEKKQIICPKNWLGFKIGQEYPEHVIPSGWIQVDINDC